MLRHRSPRLLTATVAALALTAAGSFAADKLPASLAGDLGQPTGKIAFIRGGNIWIMNANGSDQFKVSEVGNADGRISWSPDGRRLAFTRSGQVTLKAPDNLGGKHKVYDIFLAYLDSAEAGKTFWWYRLTDDLGSRDPEWGPDGTITFTKDMNANTVNALLPNYQICTMNEDGDDFEILRKDWQNLPKFFTTPSVSPDGKIAFVLLDPKEGPVGIGILPKRHFMAPMDSIIAQVETMRGNVAPSWSPDGKWLAYVKNSLTEGGLYIATPDLSKKYLVFEPPVGATMSVRTPSWSPNSKWLTFGTTDGSIWVVDITGQKPRRISGPGTDSAPAWSKGMPKKK
ncbi:MAG: hypothetical protein D6800_14810 [Candidatus Zixiibacteriota bacterium]|nr:MAG: hypothetical protein D6800_14810 [candidate division Zixibacteria bacterium]